MYSFRVNGHDFPRICVRKLCNDVCFDVEWCECFVDRWIPQCLVDCQRRWGGVSRGFLVDTGLSLTETAAKRARRIALSHFRLWSLQRVQAFLVGPKRDGRASPRAITIRVRVLACLTFLVVSKEDRKKERKERELM